MGHLETLAGRLGERLVARGWWLGVAESCTGGYLSHTITNVSGASSFVRGGIVSYANEVKRDLLGFPEDLLARCGAVSEPVARAMAEGVRRLLRAEVGLSVTGIAGPTGGTIEKPVGTVYLGVSTPSVTRVAHHVWDSDRMGNKELSVRRALELALEMLAS